MRKQAGEDLRWIHDESMEILEKTGIRFIHPPSLEILKRHGVRVEGDVAFFPEKVVLEKISMAPEVFSLKGRNGKYDVLMGGDKVELAPPFGAPFVQDSEGKNRPATLRDFVLLTKFFHQQEEFRINGGILCQPNDQDPKMAAVLMMYSLILGTDKCLVFPSGSEGELGTMLEMLKVLFGGREGLRRYARTVCLVDSISPLQIDGRTLETIMMLADYGQPLSFSSGVIAGLTGPVSLPGAIALGNAEILAGMAFSQMVSEGCPVFYGSPFAGSEMRRGSAVFGGPERVVGVRYMSRMARFYGLPSHGGGSLTDAPVLGMQSGYESFMTLQSSYGEGINCISDAAGVLESFKVVSLEKCLADMEQIRRLAYLRRRMPMDDEQFGMELIGDVGHGGDFLASDHTLRYFRASLFNPDVSVRGVRKEDYEETFRRGIEKKLRKKFSKYRRPELPAEVGKALRHVAQSYGVAEKALDEVDSLLDEQYFAF